VRQVDAGQRRNEGAGAGGDDDDIGGEALHGLRGDFLAKAGLDPGLSAGLGATC
jgi:hypothetical protein